MKIIPISIPQMTRLGIEDRYKSILAIQFCNNSQKAEFCSKAIFMNILSMFKRLTIFIVGLFFQELSREKGTREVSLLSLYFSLHGLILLFFLISLSYTFQHSLLLYFSSFYYLNKKYSNYEHRLILPSFTQGQTTTAWYVWSLLLYN